MPPTYLRFSRRLQLFGDLFSGSPAHLRWIAGVLKMARNANRMGAIFNSFISNMDRIVLLERPFSLALVLVMRYTRWKKKLEKNDVNSKKVLGAANTSRAKKSRPISYFVRRVATSSRATLSSAIKKVRNCEKNWVFTSYIASQISHKLFPSSTIAGLPAKLNSAQLHRLAGGQCLG